MEKYINELIFEGEYLEGKKWTGKGYYPESESHSHLALELNFNNDKIVGKGKLIYLNGDFFEGNFDNNYNPIDGIINYTNGDIYEGNLNMNGNRIGKGRMINKNGEIYYGEFYNNNKGLFCLNEEDYYILNSKNINNINEIFNCYELKDLFYKGNYKNNKKERKGILYINNDNYKKIYEGNFKEDLKDGFGKIYYETGSIFESYWKEDNLDEEKEAIFYLNKEIKFKKKIEYD